MYSLFKQIIPCRFSCSYQFILCFTIWMRCHNFPVAGSQHDFWKLDIPKYRIWYFVVADYSIYCFGGPSDPTVLCHPPRTWFAGSENMEVRIQEEFDQLIIDLWGMTPIYFQEYLGIGWCNSRNLFYTIQDS